MTSLTAAASSNIVSNLVFQVCYNYFNVREMSEDNNELDSQTLESFQKSEEMIEKDETLGNFFVKPKGNESLSLETSMNKNKSSINTQKLSSRERRNNYQRLWHQKKKQEIELIRQNQIKGISVLLLNINNTLRSVKITNEVDYIKLLDDLLDTLKSNGLLNDYQLDLP